MRELAKEYNKKGNAAHASYKLTGDIAQLNTAIRCYKLETILLEMAKDV